MCAEPFRASRGEICACGCFKSRNAEELPSGQGEAWMEQPQAQPPSPPAQETRPQQPRPKASTGSLSLAWAKPLSYTELNVHNGDFLELRGLPPEVLVDSNSGHLCYLSYLSSLLGVELY